MNIDKIIRRSIDVKTKLLTPEFIADLEKVGQMCVHALRNGNKILAAGNGGSSSQASHFVGELLGRFELEREALPGICLSSDLTNLTAISNDYGYERVFSKQVEGLGKKDDIFIGLTTSGNSKNIIKALEKARAKDMLTIVLNGRDGGILKDSDLVDVNLIVNDENTARIQESHILIIHIICKYIEDGLFKNS
jgi:D-sedoheptulose 7-phosphate isomerase